MLKHDIRSCLSGLMILQSVTKVEKIYVYLHKYDGAWGVESWGRPCKKPSLEEITNDLVNYFMKSSCILEVIICRESVDILIISTVPIGP